MTDIQLLGFSLQKTMKHCRLTPQPYVAVELLASGHEKKLPSRYARHMQLKLTLAKQNHATSEKNRVGLSQQGYVQL